MDEITDKLVERLRHARSVWLVFDAEDCPIDEADYCERLSDKDKRALTAALASRPSPEGWRTMESAREECAQIVEALMDQNPWSEKAHTRCALAIAARAVRRGRHLTNAEKNENLAKAFEDEGDHDIARKIRALIPPPPSNPDNESSTEER